MKRWKRMMSVILCFVMVVAGLEFCLGKTEAAGAPVFYAEDVTAEPGGEITIPVKVSGNAGLMGIGVKFTFDTGVLTPVDDIRPGSILTGQFNDSVESALANGSGAFKVLWQGEDSMAKDGELFTLKFKVSEQASGTAKITMTLLEDDTFDEKFTNVAVKCQQITVTINGGKPAQTPAQNQDTPKGSANTSTKSNNQLPSYMKSKTPRKVKLRSAAKAGKRKLKVTWSRRVEANGYQVQCAQNRKFTKRKKTVKAGWTATKKTVKGLKSKKVYYVRVRAFKNQSGKKYYGPWSNVKKCRVK